MITFHPTNDSYVVRQIMLNIHVFDQMVCGETMEDFEPPMQPWVIRLVVKEESEVLGLLWFCPWSTVCWEMHTCILPHAWGFKTSRIFKALKEYVWASVANIQRIMLVIPESNKSALACAKRNGMELVGYNPNSEVRGGVLMGNYFYGISRPEGK